jgi:hypothetical protein
MSLQGNVVVERSEAPVITRAVKDLLGLRRLGLPS